jgi:hypothetical protein
MLRVALAQYAIIHRIMYRYYYYYYYYYEFIIIIIIIIYKAVIVVVHSVRECVYVCVVGNDPAAAVGPVGRWTPRPASWLYYYTAMTRTTTTVLCGGTVGWFFFIIYLFIIYFFLFFLSTNITREFTHIRNKTITIRNKLRQRFVKSTKDTPW